MLTKEPTIVFVQGTPEIPAAPSYTVCSGGEQPGEWDNVCEELEFTVDEGQVLELPPGTVITSVETLPDGSTRILATVCFAVFVPTGPVGPVTCHTYPEQAFQAAVPSRYEVKPHYGWNAGAEHADSLDDNFRLAFDMPKKVVGAAIGITTNPDDVSLLARLSHAFYFFMAGGQARFLLMEQGKGVIPARAYTLNDSFELRRVDGHVTYWQEGALIYTSKKASTGAVFVGSSLYATGDTLPSETP